MRHQGGWAASFFIIGSVLVLGLVGGVYVLKQQSNKSTEAPIAVNAPENSDNKQSTQRAKPEQSTKEQEQTPAEQPAATSTPQVPSSNTPVGAPSTTSRLPETGPADTFGKLVAVISLTVAATVYLQSRRESFSF